MNLFTNLNEQDYKDDLILRHYHDQQLIFNEGERCEWLGIVLSGEVIISTLTYSEYEYRIITLKENDFFGDSLLFGQNNSFLGDVIANSECTIGFIHKSNLLKLCKNEVFLTNYLSMIANTKLSLQQQVKLLSQKSLEDRLLFFLMGEKKLQHSNVIRITSKEKLAASLNMPRPSLSRVLQKLEAKGLLKYNRQTITLMV